MTELDHLVLPAIDLGVAASAFADAGFVVTPEAAHPFGTANRLVVFDRVYIELVGIADPTGIPATGFARQVADHLEAGRTGFSHFACRAMSIGDAGSEIREAGLRAGDPMWFSRPAPRTDGSELIAGFTLLAIAEHPHQFFCVHHTPEAVWFRPHLLHPNGVTRIEQVTSHLTPAVPVLGLAGGSDRVMFDAPIDPIEISGVHFG